MDLTTDYLGFKLPHPFISGAGPLSDSVESAKQVEDAGAAAIVMRSLFYEQIETYLHHCLSYFAFPNSLILVPMVQLIQKS